MPPSPGSRISSSTVQLPHVIASGICGWVRSLCASFPGAVHSSGPPPPTRSVDPGTPSESGGSSGTVSTAWLPQVLKRYAKSSSATSPTWSIFGVALAARLARREGRRSLGWPPRAAGDAEWDRETMVIVNSTTKGRAMTLAVAKTARGWLDDDAPVAQYWPEFAERQERDGVPCASSSAIRQGSSCSTGGTDDCKDARPRFRRVCLLAAGKWAWPPGTAPRLSRDDARDALQERTPVTSIPAHRTLGRFFHEAGSCSVHSSSTSTSPRP